MPDMANITVKNNANADVIYVASTPSSGDRVPAVWKQNAAGTTWASRPTLKVLSRNNARNTTRIIEVDFKFPIVDADGIVTDVIPFTGAFSGVNTVDTTKIRDAFVQLGNLLASSLIRDVVTEGYAPT